MSEGHGVEYCDQEPGTNIFLSNTVPTKSFSTHILIFIFISFVAKTEKKSVCSLKLKS